MVSLVWISVVGLVWLTFAMRKSEQSKWLRTAAMLLHGAWEAWATRPCETAEVGRGRVVRWGSHWQCANGL